MQCVVVSGMYVLQILFFGIFVHTVRHKKIHVDPLSLKLFNVENEEKGIIDVSAEPARILKNRCQNAIFCSVSFSYNTSILCRM